MYRLYSWQRVHIAHAEGHCIIENIDKLWFKINLNCQNAVDQAAFPLYISIDLIVKPVSPGFPLVYAPISVKGDLPLEGDACRHRHHAYLHWFWGCGWGHGDNTAPDPVVVCPQQGGSQHVTRARGILRSARSKKPDCNKWLGSWRSGGDCHLLFCFYCSHFVCCYLWMLHISKAQTGSLIDSKVGTKTWYSWARTSLGTTWLCCSQKTLISLPGWLFLSMQLPCIKSNVPMPASCSAGHSKLTTWGCLDSGTATFNKYQSKLVSDFHLSSKTTS